MLEQECLGECFLEKCFLEHLEELLNFWKEDESIFELSLVAF